MEQEAGGQGEGGRKNEEKRWRDEEKEKMNKRRCEKKGERNERRKQNLKGEDKGKEKISSRKKVESQHDTSIFSRFTINNSKSFFLMSRCEVLYTGKCHGSKLVKL